MYITLEHLAEYLHVTPQYIKQQVELGNIRGVFDGQQYLFNQAQFQWHKEQLERRILQWKDEQNETIPEDIDVKDED